MKPQTYEELAKLIDESDEWCVGGLIRIYQMQAADEQMAGCTVHVNGVGFNSFDAGPMTNISNWYLDKGFLTDRQIIFVRKTIKKYVNQMLGLGVSPLSLKKPEIRDEKPLPCYKKAEFLNEKRQYIKATFSFPKGDTRFVETLNFVKSLSDRRWDSDSRCWKVGASLENGERMLEFGFEFTKDLEAWISSFKGETATEISDIEIPGLNGTLMPFQSKGIAFVESRNGRALIADEMGLGKTVQAAGYLQLHPEIRPALVVCPASLKINWKNELKKWLSCGDKIQIASGREPSRIWGSILIINYDILTYWKDEILKHGFRISIWDECHYMKNSKAQRTKNGKKIAKAIDQIILLSGTPIVNRAAEFFNPINMVRPDLFPSYWKYMHEYTNAAHNGFGWQFSGCKNAEKLHKILTETIMIRRTKDEVLKDLPPKVRSVIPFEIDNRREYNNGLTEIKNRIKSKTEDRQREFDKWLQSDAGKKADRIEIEYKRSKIAKVKNAEFVMLFEKLKQLAVAGKMIGVSKWIEDFLESDQKLVVFATHKKTLDILQEQFGALVVRLDGSTSPKDRQVVVDKFQTDPNIRLFLGNVKAAGVGITLTAASNVAFIELPWTPGDFEQAADRCHRIGQEDSVNIWCLIAEDTIEESIARILSEKQKTLDAVLDGKETEENSLLSELIKELKGEE